MKRRSSRPHSRPLHDTLVRCATLGAVVVLALAACSPGAEAGPASPATGSATSTAAPATPSPTAAGPTAYGAWVARQGFGGSSGLREVRKNAQWNQANIGEVTAGMIEIEDMPVVDTLVGWLDMHPATACWADYHAKARAALTAIHDDYTGIRDSLADGNGAPVKLVTDAVSTADDLSELPTPADCP